LNIFICHQAATKQTTEKKKNIETTKHAPKQPTDIPRSTTRH